MLNWDDLRCLVCLGRGQTLSSAALALSTSVSTVSRRIERMNADASEPIATKNGTTWQLTEHGQKLAQAALMFQENLDQIEGASVESGRGKLAPRIITLTAPDAIIRYYLTPKLAEFAEREPKIELNVISDPFGKRLGEGKVDLSLLVEPPSFGRHLVQKVGKTIDGIFCKKGTIPDKWIGLDRSLDDTKVMKMGRAYFGKDPDLRLSNLSLIKEILDESGWAGVGMDVLYPKNEGYQKLGGEAFCSELDVWLSYHETRRHDKALQIVRDFLICALRG